MSSPSAADPSAAANPPAAAPSDRPARRSPTPTKRGAGGPTPGSATKASSDSTASGEARVAAAPAAAPPAPPAPKPQLGTNLYDVAWTPDEQATLEAGLTRYDETRYTSLWRYIKIAAELPAKGVRDVALRVRWMRRRGNGASGGNGSGNASGKRQKRGGQQSGGGEIAAAGGGARANAGASGSRRPPSVFEMRAPTSGFSQAGAGTVGAPHHHPAAFGSIGATPHGLHPAATRVARRHGSRRPGADAYVVGGAGAGGGMGTGQIVGGAGPGPGPGPGRGGAGVRVGTPVVGTPVGIGVPGLVPVPSGMRSGGGTIGGGVGGGDDGAGGRPSTTAGAHGGASRAARARARHVPMAIGVTPVNPQHQNQNHPAAAMGPGVSGVRFHQGGAGSVRPRRASIALAEHGGADFFRQGRGLPGSVAPEVAATLEANVALVAEIRAVNHAEGGNSRAAAMKNAERLATLRDNLVRVSEAMRDAPGIMARMPRLPARLDLALADATLRPMGGVPEEGGGARSEGAGGAEGEGEGEGEGGAAPGGRGRGGRRGRGRAKS